MKAGFKTSEFMSTMLGVLGMVAYGVEDDSPVVRAASVLGLSLVVSAYAFSRGTSKK